MRQIFGSIAQYDRAMTVAKIRSARERMRALFVYRRANPIVLSQSLGGMFNFLSLLSRRSSSLLTLKSRPGLAGTCLLTAPSGAGLPVTHARLNEVEGTVAVAFLHVIADDMVQLTPPVTTAVNTNE